MNPNELLRLVDSLHRDKHIETERVFEAIEAALVTALRKFRGDEANILVSIDRETGAITARVDDEVLDQSVIGRIGAQTAKQVIIQKIKEAERDALLEEFQDQVGELVTGTVQRTDRGVTIVQIGNVEAILPRGQQIPGETYHHGDRIKAVIYEVKAAGNRVKVILSRTNPQLVRRLFEQEIPEIAEGVVEIKAVSREPGHRSKVAVYSIDQNVDSVGACVGVRGNRIKNITAALAGERIDIVRWSDDPMELIPAALQPAEVDQVLLCDMIGRAIVLVKEDQLSQAIGRFGQNVRLASKLVGWDIEIMTAEELEDQIDRAISAFMELEGMTDELAQQLVEQGYLSYDDLSVIEPDILMELGGLTEEQVDQIVTQAEERAEEAERIAQEEKRLEKERKAIEEMARQNPATADLVPETAGEQRERASAEPVGDASQQSDAAGEASAAATEVSAAQAGEAAEPEAEEQAAAGADVAAEEGTSDDSAGSPGPEAAAAGADSQGAVATESEGVAGGSGPSAGELASGETPEDQQEQPEQKATADDSAAVEHNEVNQVDVKGSPGTVESSDDSSGSEQSESQPVSAKATSSADSTSEETMDRTNATDRN